MLYFRFFTGLGMVIVFVLVMMVAFVCALRQDISGIQLLLITTCAVVGVGLSLELCIEAHDRLDEIHKQK